MPSKQSLIEPAEQFVDFLNALEQSGFAGEISPQNNLSTSLMPLNKVGSQAKYPPIKRIDLLLLLTTVFISYYRKACYIQNMKMT